MAQGAFSLVVVGVRAIIFRYTLIMSPIPARQIWIRSLWQLEVREGVFIHPTADVVQEMGNKGYDVAAIETLVAKGHQLLMNYFILLIYAITKK